MSDSTKVAVVGRMDAVAPLRAAGLAIFGAEAGPGARAEVERILAAGYQVVFYTAELAADVGPLVHQSRGRPLPCIVALPGTGRDALVDRLKEIVKRAVGADIFGSGPERS